MVANGRRDPSVPIHAMQSSRFWIPPSFRTSTRRQGTPQRAWVPKRCAGRHKGQVGGTQGQVRFLAAAFTFFGTCHRMSWRKGACGASMLPSSIGWRRPPPPANAVRRASTACTRGKTRASCMPRLRTSHGLNLSAEHSRSTSNNTEVPRPPPAHSERNRAPPSHAPSSNGSVSPPKHPTPHTRATRHTTTRKRTTTRPHRRRGGTAGETMQRRKFLCRRGTLRSAR
jgi:hypothetical protein